MITFAPRGDLIGIPYQHQARESAPHLGWMTDDWLLKLTQGPHSLAALLSFYAPVGGLGAFLEDFRSPLSQNPTPRGGGPAALKFTCSWLS